MPRNLQDPTECEINALRAVAKHGTIKAAAEALYISPHTVKTHLDILRGKTGRRFLPQLIDWAFENGWLADRQPS